jgi:2-oxoglutarate ferredoxin oxidoreductase subunit gamma
VKNGRVTLQFCGFGGQGIVLSAIVFGAAAVTRAGINAVQTQSYGSEARGGECQAELILSGEPIGSPLADQVHILVAMSRSALSRYLDRLKPGGALLIDPELLERPARPDIQVYQVPASRMAQESGSQIAANMAMLGFLQAATQIISGDDLCSAIRDQVPARFLDINLRAAQKGMALAEAQHVTIEA